MRYTMKYIKKFEALNVDEYYHIYSSEDDIIINSKRIPIIHSKSHSKLIDILKKGNVEIEIGDNFIVVNKDGINYYIIEHIDEWFVVDMVDDTYGASELYLCDQYDGLIKFLNDKEVITYRDGTI